MLISVGYTADQMGRGFQKLFGGEQRVAIVIALVADAGILLADEPIRNLDTDTVKGIIEALRNYRTRMGNVLSL